MKINITGVSGSRVAYYAAKEIVKKKKTMIIVSRADVATRLKEDISFFVQDREIFIMPEEDELQIVYEAKDSNATVQSLKALDALCSDEEAIVIAPISAALKSLQPAKRFIDSVIKN